MIYVKTFLIQITFDALYEVAVLYESEVSEFSCDSIMVAIVFHNFGNTMLFKVTYCIPRLFMGPYWSSGNYGTESSETLLCQN